MGKSNILIMAELKMLLRDGALPLKFVKRTFKEKGLTNSDFENGCEMMELVQENWRGAAYIRLPRINEDYKHR